MVNRSVVSRSHQLSRRLKWSACLGLAVLPLFGCATVNLKKVAIVSMDVSLPTATGIAPGEKQALAVAMNAANGKVFSTKANTGDGRISWNDLNVAATVVNAGKKGKVSLPADPRVSDGKLPHIAITAPSHPDLRADLDLPIRYDRKFNASFSGPSGPSGSDGMNGSDGISGSMGSLDPNNPSPGGNGSDGTNGSPGSNGWPGGDGPSVQVRVALRSGSHPLLQVSASAQGRMTFFLIDPQGGSLTVASNGGPGGSGGHGGRGGRGGSGGIGTPSGMNGSDGLNGPDGMDGPSGRGGKITVIYDPEAQPFLGAIHLSDTGGPRPVFLEQPVAALW